MTSPVRVLRCEDESHLISMDLLLEAEGIRHTLHRPTMESVGGNDYYVSVNADDHDRAAALARTLQVTRARPAADDRRYRIFAWSALLVFALAVLLLLTRH